LHSRTVTRIHRVETKTSLQRRFLSDTEKIFPGVRFGKYNQFASRRKDRRNARGFSLNRASLVSLVDDLTNGLAW
jgi:hypothetical protein